MSLSTFLLGGSTAILVIWGVVDWRGTHRRDAVFLWLLAAFDAAAAIDSHHSFLQLESRLAPRHLAGDERSRFVAELANVPKLPVVILENADLTPAEMEEEYGFAEDIRAAFEQAGWSVRLDKVQFPRRPRVAAGFAVWATPTLGDTNQKTLNGIGGAFEDLRYFPTIGWAPAQELAGAVREQPEWPDERGGIRIDVYPRPPS